MVTWLQIQFFLVIGMGFDVTKKKYRHIYINKIINKYIFIKTPLYISIFLKKWLHGYKYNFS